MVEAVQLSRVHLERYLDSLPPGQVTQAGRYAQMFFDRCRDNSRQSLEDFFSYIRSEYADGSVRYIWGVIHRLYVVNGWEWPFRRAETPMIRERNVFAPILSPDVIREMIEAAQTVLTIRQAFYVAVATTYGCRRTELAALTRHDINLQDRLIYIATKHLGRERYHVIPDPILPVIQKACPRLDKPASVKTLDRIYRRIEDAIAFPHVKELGWHAIRRCVNRQLLDVGLPEFIVADFLRWKREGRVMPLRYARGTIIGRETQETETLSLQDRATDERVFEVHPFLPCWRS